MESQDLNQEKHSKKCSKCKEHFTYMSEETFWDEHGYGYSVKLVKCPLCGSFNIIKYSEDISLDINNDKKYYDMKRKR